jgi:hypothetical protein
MPTNRRRRRPAYVGISQEMVEAWLAGDRARLCTLAGIRPWQWAPTDSLPPVPPPPPGDAAAMRAYPNAHAGWHRAVQLRVGLLRYGTPA